MALSHAFAGFQLSAARQTPAVTLPAGLSRFTVSFDVSGFTVGQVVFLSLEFSTDNGTTWQSLGAMDFDGPWRDKQGVLQTVVSGTFVFGVDVNRQQVTAPAGTQFRGTLTPVNGPIAIGAGSVSAV